MSINIPAETPDESTNPISVEEFERLHPAMLGAISVRAYAQQKTSEKISPKERWAFETQCNGLAVAVAECQSGI